jgi:hypothetical protein
MKALSSGKFPKEFLLDDSVSTKTQAIRMPSGLMWVQMEGRRFGFVLPDGQGYYLENGTPEEMKELERILIAMALSTPGAIAQGDGHPGEDHAEFRYSPD